MLKTRVYVDTSVFGGTQDTVFQIESNAFFDRVQAGEYIIILSDLTIGELTDAPEAVRLVINSLPDEAIEEVIVDDEVKELADKYLEAKVLGPASQNDALHVAAASVAGAELILSWNFKHIVNFNRIKGFNGVNVGLGYRPVTILSPWEVVGYEKENQ